MRGGGRDERGGGRFRSRGVLSLKRSRQSRRGNSDFRCRRANRPPPSTEIIRLLGM